MAPDGRVEKADAGMEKVTTEEEGDEDDADDEDDAPLSAAALDIGENDEDFMSGDEVPNDDPELSDTLENRMARLPAPPALDTGDSGWNVGE